jgi:hypothetical protein
MSVEFTLFDKTTSDVKYLSIFDVDFLKRRFYIKDGVVLDDMHHDVPYLMLSWTKDNIQDPLTHVVSMFRDVNLILIRLDPARGHKRNILKLLELIIDDINVKDPNTASVLRNIIYDEDAIIAHAMAK